MDQNHNENKEFLWNFLTENNIINPKSQNEVKTIQRLFETVYATTIIANKNQSRPMIELNKEFINGMVVSIKEMKEQIQQPYSKDEIQKERHAMMNKKFEGKQQEFSKLINAARPAEIDFSDKTDEDEVITKFKMESTLAQREKELQEIMAANSEQTTKDAEKWINAGSDARPEPSSIEPTNSQGNELLNPPRLDIKNETIEKTPDVIELTVQETNKKVSFKKDVEFLDDVVNNSHSDFLSKLKKKPVQEGNKEFVIQEMQQDILQIKQSMLQLTEKVNKFIDLQTEKTTQMERETPTETPSV